MKRAAIFAEIDAALAPLMPPRPVEMCGAWLPSGRRTYESAGQEGSGTGPFVNVVDYRWQGALTAAVPIAAIAFMTTDGELRWSKSMPAVPAIELTLSLHAYQDRLPNRATFGAAVGGALLPGRAVTVGANVPASCSLREAPLTTARVEPLAIVDGTAVWVLLLEEQFQKVGRQRLWRVRDSVAAGLPDAVRQLLTRRRSGTIDRE